MMNRVYKISLVLSGLLLIAALMLFLQGNAQQTGPLLIFFFITVAIGLRGYERTKGFVYTIMIFAAATTALYYPSYFQQLNGVKLTRFITPLIQLIMFGMGASMSIHDFVAVAKTPKGVAIGVVGHYIIMPMLGYTLATVSGLPPEIAAGIVLIGCSPSGTASSVICYLAKANLALSISVTSISTLLAPLMTPLLMKLLAGELIEIDTLGMMWDIIKMVILPIAAGLVFNKFLGQSKWLDKLMPLISMLSIGFVIVIVTAAGRDSLLDIGAWLMLLVLIHNMAGYTLGYWAGRFFKLNERDSRTIAIEVGMQNAGLASGIAKGMGKIATVGLAPAVFGPLMNVTGSILASYWQRKTTGTGSTGR